MDEKTILSEIIFYSKYANFLPELGRRETFEEAVERNRQMHLDYYKNRMSDELELLINEAYGLVKQKKILPSMRSLQFGGDPILKKNTRMFNCSFTVVDDTTCFSEIMFLLLCGCGVGYSVQKRHIEKLPEITMPFYRAPAKPFVIEDTIEGWADAVKHLFSVYTSGGVESPIEFDFSRIRPEGSLVGKNWKAPGPEPLKKSLNEVEQILLSAIESSDEPSVQLTPLQVHDIICTLSNAVLAGGVRRSALIVLFDKEDWDMAQCKYFDKIGNNQQRYRANNSAALDRRVTSYEEFMELMNAAQESQSGEPGVYWTNDLDSGTNPCCEIALKDKQFCNLTTINLQTVESQEDFETRAYYASVLGTLQAGYTNFNYIRDKWRKNCEEESLLGVSMTGICGCDWASLDYKKGALQTKEANEKVANLLGINPSARITCVKPEGTSSLLLGTSSGVHAYHSRYYKRNMRFGRNESIAEYLLKVAPEFCEPSMEAGKEDKEIVFGIPIFAGEFATTRGDETALGVLKRVKHLHENWIVPGHRTGVNTHNVSCTINVREDEWPSVKEWMWHNRASYNGIAVFPYFGGVYKQAPFEEITKEEYEKLKDALSKIDFDIRDVEEKSATVDLRGEQACAGGACEI